jgi:hypothetical protein
MYRNKSKQGLAKHKKAGTNIIMLRREREREEGDNLVLPSFKRV